MKKYQGPITETNFSESWDYVNQKIASAKRKRIVEVLVKIFGNVTFLLCALVISFGVFHHVESEGFAAYLKATPVLGDIWQKIEGALYHPDISLAGQIAIYILTLFAVTASVCALLLLLVWVIYRPQPVSQRSEDMAADSKELYQLSKLAVMRAGKPKEATSAVCMVLYMIGIVVYVLAYLAISGLGKTEQVADAEVTDIFSEQTAIVVVMLVLMGTYLVVSIVAGFLMKLFYVTRIPKTLVADAESYYFELNESDKIRMVEEERILALAKEIKAQRYKENQELLRKGKKKYEFFKVFEFQKKRDQEPDNGAEENV